MIFFHHPARSKVGVGRGRDRRIPAKRSRGRRAEKAPDYKAFTLLDASLARILDQGRAELTLGKETDFNLQLRPRYVRERKPEIIQLKVRFRQLLPPPSSLTPAAGTDIKQAVPLTSSKTLIETQLTIKSGDKTVVGVSKLDGSDKGLILIISGKVIN